MKSGFAELQARVIARGLCTGCGTCAGICPRSALEIGYEEGEPQPREKGHCVPCGICLEACPGEDIPFSDLEQYVFGRAHSESDQMGIFQKAYAACAADDGVRTSGSDGGVATALLIAALETRFIDCAIVADYSPAEPWRAVATIATSADQVRQATVSKYMLVSPGSLLSAAASHGRIGLIASPCVIHALRKIQMKGLVPQLAQKLVLQLGLYCAAQFYFEGTKHLLQEYLQVKDLSEVKRIQYRGGKYPGSFVVETRDGRRSEMSRSDFMLQFLIHYRRDRCEMCVDYSSELADISMGAYYPLPDEPKEAEKKTTTIVRTAKGAELFNMAMKAGYLRAGEISYSDLFLHGSLGFELKKHIAAFRLQQRQRFGWPTPNFHYRPGHEPFPRPRPHILREGS